MATTAHLTSGTDSVPTTTYTTGSFTPTAGSLVIAIAVISDHTTFDASSCTDSTGRFKMQRHTGQYRYAASVHSLLIWYADVAANAVSRTLTFNSGSDAGTGCAWEVFEINGASRLGPEALRQKSEQVNGAGGATPQGNWGAAALTGNVCVMAVANNSSPAGITNPASFTTICNVGYATPTTGLHVSVRNSGHTSTNVTCGSTSASTYGSVALEFDCTSSETISPVSIGTQPTATGTGTGTTSCAPDYPPATAEGDAIVMALGIKPDTATAPTITSWSKVSNTDATGGTGSVGVDTGPCRVCWYIYDPDGDGSGVGSSPPGGTLTVTPGSTPSCCWAMMLAFRSSFGATVSWSAAGGNGSDTTTGTPFTAAMGTDPGVAIGDYLLFAGVTPTDVNMPTPPIYKYSTLVVSGTSFTDGRAAEGITRYEANTSNGNDAGGIITRDYVLTAATSVLTFSMAAGGTTTAIAGPIALCRLRASAGVAATLLKQARRRPARHVPPGRGTFN